VARSARDRLDSPAPPADSDLAQDLLRQKPEAALEAWQRFSPAVAVVLRRMLGPGSDVEDLVQDVFLRFFEAIRELRKLESIRAFITGIAIRRAQEEIRRRDVRRRLAHLLPSFLRPRTIELDTQSRDAVAHLYRALDSLGADDRVLYVLRFIQGLDHARLAEALEVSVPTVRRRLDRLVERMDRLIQADPVLADCAAAFTNDPSVEEREHE
jgi:RNA polymerase sigma factor (sigma-70 family)